MVCEKCGMPLVLGRVCPHCGHIQGLPIEDDKRNIAENMEDYWKHLGREDQ